MNLKEISWIRNAAFIWRSFQSKRSYRYGCNNLIINEGGGKVGSRVQITGNGNRLVIEKGAMLFNSLVKIQGDNNSIVLKTGSYVSGAELWVEDNGCNLSIGERTFVGKESHLACTENGSRLMVGSDCMISSHVQIRTGDSHSILDSEGKRINLAGSVSIGNHVWLGEGCKVLKGVTLEGDNIVSSGAIVTKTFGRNLLLGGVPARILKDNVTWDKERV